MADSSNIDTTRQIARQQQHELFEGAQQRMAAWMNRRQEALETGLDALKRMSACKTPVEMAVIYGEWLSGSMTRVLADFEDGQAHAVKMAEHLRQASRSVLAPTAVEPVPPVVAEEPSPPQQLRQAA